MKKIISVTLCAIMLFAVIIITPVAATAPEENAYYIDSINAMTVTMVNQKLPHGKA